MIMSNLQRWSSLFSKHDQTRLERWSSSVRIYDQWLAGSMIKKDTQLIHIHWGEIVLHWYFCCFFHLAKPWNDDQDNGKYKRFSDNGHLDMIEWTLGTDFPRLLALQYDNESMIMAIFLFFFPLFQFLFMAN